MKRKARSLYGPQRLYRQCWRDVRRMDRATLGRTAIQALADIDPVMAAALASWRARQEVTA